MATFLSVPREIRDQIYREGLTVSEVICPDVSKKESRPHLPTHKVQGHVLAIGLLSTSKYIREEALQIFIGGNQWRIQISNRWVDEDEDDFIPKF